MGDRSRTGQLLQSRLHQDDGRHGAGERLSDESHHRQEYSLDGARARQDETLLHHDSSQGHPPQLDGQHARAGTLRRQGVPRAGDVLRRLRGPRGSAAAGDEHHQGHGRDLRPEDEPRRQEEPPEEALRILLQPDGCPGESSVGCLLRAHHQRFLCQEPLRQGAGGMEVSALHARLREGGEEPRRQRGTRPRLSGCEGARQEHPGGLHLRPRVLHGRARMVRQAIHV